MAHHSHHLHGTYNEVLAAAMMADLDAMEELLSFFTERELLTHRRAAMGHSPRLKHLSMLYQYLRDQVGRAITYVEVCQLRLRQPQIGYWHHYANHEVPLCPYFGPFSLYDKARLIEGIPGGRAGLKELEGNLPGYGSLCVTPTGWYLTLRETPHLFSGIREEREERNQSSSTTILLPFDEETLHRLVVNAAHVEDVPFTHTCVMPFPPSSSSSSFPTRPSPWKAPLDGLSVVIAPGQAFYTRDGELVEWRDTPTRISMARLHYEALVYSVAYDRYNDARGSMDLHKEAHQRTLACFGTSRIPRSSREVDQWLGKSSVTATASSEKEAEDLLALASFSHSSSQSHRAAPLVVGDGEELIALEDQPF